MQPKHDSSSVAMPHKSSQSQQNRPQQHIGAEQKHGGCILCRLSAVLDSSQSHLAVIKSALSFKTAVVTQTDSMGESSCTTEIPWVDAFTTQHTSVLRGAWAQCEAVGAGGVGGQSGGGVDKLSSTSRLRFCATRRQVLDVRGDERVGGCVELTGQRGRAQKRVSAWRSHTWFSSLLFQDYILDLGIGASRWTWGMMFTEPVVWWMVMDLRHDGGGLAAGTDPGAGGEDSTVH